MIPALMPGDTVFGWTSRIKTGDIVVAKRAAQEVIKRVKVVESESVYLVGDNGLESTDSREYGSVSKDDILAVIMITLPTASPAPPLRKPFGMLLGLVNAAIFTIFALIHLFRIDTFIPEINYSLPGGYEIAKIIGVLIIVAEIFALPFLLRMSLSPLARFLSGFLVVITPLAWLLISIWNYGFTVSTAQLGAFYALPSSLALIVANIIWLLFSVYTLWALGYDTPQKLRKKR